MRVIPIFSALWGGLMLVVFRPISVLIALLAAPLLSHAIIFPRLVFQQQRFSGIAIANPNMDPTDSRGLARGPGPAGKRPFYTADSRTRGPARAPFSVGSGPVCVPVSIRAIVSGRSLMISSRDEPQPSQ
jgi:hypothetical protein